MTAARLEVNAETLNTSLEGGDYIVMPPEVMELKSYKGVKLTGKMKLAYCLVLNHTGDNRKVEFSQSYLAACLSCSLRTANKVITDLKRLNLVVADPNHRGEGGVQLLEALPIMEEFAEFCKIEWC